MLKKRVKYTNFNDEVKERDLYFNITKKEILDMSLEDKGSLKEQIELMGKTQDPELVLSCYTKIVQMSYGEKSEDGEHFIKTSETARHFIESAAFDELFMELLSDANKMVDFVNGILPKDLLELVNKEMENERQKGTDLPLGNE